MAGSQTSEGEAPPDYGALRGHQEEDLQVLGHFAKWIQPLLRETATAIAHGEAGGARPQEEATGRLVLPPTLEESEKQDQVCTRPAGM